MTSLAVIGAGGFLGSWVLRSANRRADLAPTAIVRRPGSAARIASDLARTVCADSDTALTAALDGMDCAIDVSLPAADLIPDLALRIANAAKAASVRRLIYVSSAAAAGGRHRTFYGRMKAEAERRLGGVGRELEVVIVRPGLIWGPGSPWTLTHLRRVGSGLVSIPTNAATWPALSYVENLVETLVAEALGSQSRGIMHPSDNWFPTWKSYYAELAIAMGWPEPAVIAAKRPLRGTLQSRAIEVAMDTSTTRRLGEWMIARMPSLLALAKRAQGAPPPPPDRFWGLEQQGRATVEFSRSELAPLLDWSFEPEPSAMPKTAPASKDAAFRATAQWGKRALGDLS